MKSAGHISGQSKRLSRRRESMPEGGAGFDGKGSIPNGRMWRQRYPELRPVTQVREGTSTDASRALISHEQIRAYCHAVAQKFLPEKIILFGSYAYGHPTPDSDVDLLIVLPFRGNDTAKAIQIRSRFSAPFPLDLLVRKPEFIAERLRERDMFIELVMTQGVVMHESEHS